MVHNASYRVGAQLVAYSKFHLIGSLKKPDFGVLAPFIIIWFLPIQFIWSWSFQFLFSWSSSWHSSGWIVQLADVNCLLVPCTKFKAISSNLLYECKCMEMQPANANEGLKPLMGCLVDWFLFWTLKILKRNMVVNFQEWFLNLCIFVSIRCFLPVSLYMWCQLPRPQVWFIEHQALVFICLTGQA